MADILDIVKEIEFYETFPPYLREPIVARLQLAISEIPQIVHAEVRRQKRALATPLAQQQDPA